jgi:2-oxoglutarate ferredoxin oxidoreductase subunit beta
VTTATPASYRRPGATPIWCAGCGNYGTYTALQRALAAEEIPRDLLVLVSGIGCSSRLPYFVDSYGLHTVHGRALPAATGITLAAPELTVVVMTGDGDGLSIGAGHFLHAARRNPDLTCLLSNNGVYGMTKGQVAPTSPLGRRSPTTPLGSVDRPLNPAALALAAGACYVARGYVGRLEELAGLIRGAIRHPGFALVEILSPCVTFNREAGYEALNRAVRPLPGDHDPGDLPSAFARSLEEGGMAVGLLLRRDEPSLDRRLTQAAAVCAPPEEIYRRVLRDHGA